MKQVESECQRLRGRYKSQLLTTGQAAEELGVKSVNTIKRWIYEGQLEGYRRGGRVMVSVESVAHILATSHLDAHVAPELARRKHYEERLEQALEAVDALAAEDEAPLPQRGQKPWDGDDPSA